VAVDGRVMEGTRLTIMKKHGMGEEEGIGGGNSSENVVNEDGTLQSQKLHPDVNLGFEFSIRTPGTPSRWDQMDFEMKFVFDFKQS